MNDYIIKLKGQLWYLELETTKYIYLPLSALASSSRLPRGDNPTRDVTSGRDPPTIAATSGFDLCALRV
jgi:hypothetical protein